MDPSGSVVVFGSADRSVSVYDVQGGYRTHTFQGHTCGLSAVSVMAEDLCDQFNGAACFVSSDGRRAPELWPGRCDQGLGSAQIQTQDNPQSCADDAPCGAQFLSRDITVQSAPWCIQKMDIIWFRPVGIMY